MRIFLCMFCLLFAFKAGAQVKGLSPDTLQAKLALYAKINAAGLLYVHTDKTLYTNNEPIWFAGYLVNTGLGKLADHTIISVSLMREDDRRIVAEQQNVMEGGLGNGNLIIPDNVPPGNYLFNACTNVLDQHGKPIAIFSQPLTIKSITQRKFSATLALLDTEVVNGMVRASVVLNIQDEKRPNKPSIAYTAGSKTEKISLGDKESSATLSIPASQLNGVDPVLLTEVAYNYDTLFLSVKMPKLQAKGLKVRFFPEGGNLTDGLESVIALEATTTAGSQLPLTGILYSNDKPVDTISTNSYGIGRFKLKPFKGNQYTFRIKANAYLQKDSSFVLPDIIDNGVVLRFTEAVINDTLRMTLYSKQDKKVQVVIHNYKEAFTVFNTTAYPEGKKLSLVLPTLPKGISTVTILDEEGRPLAERIFFAHYDHRITATIKTDKSTYNKRDSVAVTITLKDHKGKPVQAILSIAVVQENRIEGSKEQDIESYIYLNHDLGSLPRDPLGRGFDDKDYLENMFLARGWRRYTWQGLKQAKAPDTLSMGPKPEFKGNVMYYGKPLKKPVEVIVMRSSAIDKIKTAADGTFSLNEDVLQTPEGKKVFLWYTKPDIKGYRAQLDNPFTNINIELAKDLTIPTTSNIRSRNGDVEENLNLQDNILLNVVNITASKKDDALFGKAFVPGVNACGDYVCEYGYLNCPVHTPSNSQVRAPIKGEYVAIQHPSGRKIYQDCNIEGARPIAAVYIEREFYGLNREPEGILEPQNLSTPYWKSGSISDADGKLLFSFFTSDILGKFRIVVEGFGINHLIYNKYDFTVK